MFFYGWFICFPPWVRHTCWNLFFFFLTAVFPSCTQSLQFPLTGKNFNILKPLSHVQQVSVSWWRYVFLLEFHFETPASEMFTLFHLSPVDKATGGWWPWVCNRSVRENLCQNVSIFWSPISSTHDFEECDCLPQQDCTAAMGFPCLLKAVGCFELGRAVALDPDAVIGLWQAKDSLHFKSELWL